ncbi:hypothetical protein ABZX93_00650 [Streptomyces sp. NPDC006632]|uniref:hypothetical protein n=1 Tax=unclassified Streptomyces TaxID=2593676 RepID=UPI002E1F21D9
MRLRSSLAAAVGALALAVTLPASSAGAATGQFVFTYERDGKTIEDKLHDPRARFCINLDEVSKPGTTPAHSPRNRTNSRATVYPEIDCEGEGVGLKALSGKAGPEVKVRSVIFNQ